MVVSMDPGATGPNRFTRGPGPLAVIRDGTSADDAAEILRLSFSRCLRGYMEEVFPSREEFLDLTNINRGHLGSMSNGKVDPKLSMLLRCTRSIGHCPTCLLCELCSRSYGHCVVPLVSPFPRDAKTLKEIHEFYLKPSRRAEG